MVGEDPRGGRGAAGTRELSRSFGTPDDKAITPGSPRTPRSTTTKLDATATLVLRPAVARCTVPGVHRATGANDNGCAHKSHLWADTCAEPGHHPEEDPALPATEQRQDRTLPSHPGRRRAFKRFYNTEHARWLPCPNGLHAGQRQPAPHRDRRAQPHHPPDQLPWSGQPARTYRSTVEGTNWSASSMTMSSGVTGRSARSSSRSQPADSATTCVAEVEVECRHEHRPDDEGVEEDAQRDGEADLGERDHRHRREDRERACEDEPGRGDDATGGGEPGERAAPGADLLRPPRGPGSSGRCCSRCRVPRGTRRRTAVATGPRRRSRTRAGRRSALKPIAAPNESTTVPISSSGAMTARSSSTRMSRTTPRMSGMIRLLSSVRGTQRVERVRGVAADDRVCTRDLVRSHRGSGRPCRGRVGCPARRSASSR